MRADDRRHQLLDAAAQIIVEHGTAALSMERPAGEAGVSKALPYKHFDNSEDVLAALYRRETAALGRSVWQALSSAAPDHDLIRLSIRVYFEEVSRRGPVLAALSAPGSSVPSVADPGQAGVTFEVEVFNRFHGLDRDRAKLVAGMIQGARGRRHRHLARRSRPPRRARGCARRDDQQPARPPGPRALRRWSRRRDREPIPDRLRHGGRPSIGGSKVARWCPAVTVLPWDRRTITTRGGPMTGTTDWDDVGKRFADLGRRLDDTWKECRDDDAARDQLRDASDKVKTALDDVAETIDRALASSEVREATRSATTGVVGALAATLHQVAGWIEDAMPDQKRSGDRPDS